MIRPKIAQISLANVGIKRKTPDSDRDQQIAELGTQTISGPNAS